MGTCHFPSFKSGEGKEKGAARRAPRSVEDMEKLWQLLTPGSNRGIKLSNVARAANK